MKVYDSRGKPGFWFGHKIGTRHTFVGSRQSGGVHNEFEYPNIFMTSQRFSKELSRIINTAEVMKINVWCVDNLVAVYRKSSKSASHIAYSRHI